MADIRQADDLITATDGFEERERELTVPQSKLKQAGATVHVATPKSWSASKSIRGWDKTD